MGARPRRQPSCASRCAGRQTSRAAHTARQAPRRLTTRKGRLVCSRIRPRRKRMAQTSHLRMTTPRITLLHRADVSDKCYAECATARRSIARPTRPSAAEDGRRGSCTRAIARTAVRRSNDDVIACVRGWMMVHLHAYTGTVHCRVPPQRERGEKRRERSRKREDPHPDSPERLRVRPRRSRELGSSKLVHWTLEDGGHSAIVMPSKRYALIVIL